MIINRFPSIVSFCGWATVAAICCLAGCAGDQDQQKIEFGREMVQLGLDAWKSGTKPEALKTRDVPLEFLDEDWERSVQLLEYTIEKSFLDGGTKTARCWVELQLKRKNQSPQKIECMYQITTEPKLIVSRDPMS